MKTIRTIFIVIVLTFLFANVSHALVITVTGPPSATITSPTTNVSVPQNQTVSFSGYGTSPSCQLVGCQQPSPVTAYEWRESVCATGQVLSTASSFNLATPTADARTIYFRAMNSHGWSTNCPSRVVTVVKEAKAQSSSSSLSGYAWSDNVGWISFNCANTNSCATSNYSVNIDQNGKMSGYAWSDNVGWFSFEPNDVSGCPDAPQCTPKLNKGTGNVTGWFKALAGNTANSGGWDGWIKISGTWSNGVSASGSSFSGYAWGSDVLGWIDWSQVTGNQLVCSGNAGNACNSPANACGDTNQSTIQCDGSCGAQFAPPNPTNYGNNCTGNSVSCGLRNLGTFGCNDSCTATLPAESVCLNLASCINISANPEVTGLGGYSTLSWSASCGGGQFCALYKASDGIIIATTTSGTKSVGPINSVSKYAVTCNKGNNSYYNYVIVSPSNAKSGKYEEF